LTIAIFNITLFVSNLVLCPRLGAVPKVYWNAANGVCKPESIQLSVAPPFDVTYLLADIN
jgi:hypothetical protein